MEEQKIENENTKQDTIKNNRKKEQKKSKTKVIKYEFQVDVSVPLIDKLLSPTIELAAEKIRDLANWMVDEAIRRMAKYTSKAKFRDTRAFEPTLLIDEESIEIKIAIDSLFSKFNPYEYMHPWHWPIANADTHNSFIDELLPNNGTICDKDYFATLLSQSLSLDKSEKQRVINAWPDLGQFQVDALIDVFKQEKEKFKEHIITHENDVYKLIFKTQLWWAQILLKSNSLGAVIYINPSLKGTPLYTPFTFRHEYWGMAGQAIMDETKNYEASKIAFEHAIKLHPNMQFYWRMLGHCYGRTKNFEAAAAVLIKSTKLGASNSSIFLDIAEYFILSGHYNEAERYLRLAKNSLTDKYIYIHDTLNMILNHFIGINISIPETIVIFLDDMDNQTTWYWQDLKDKIKNESDLSDPFNMKIYRILQQLVSRE
jgi:tetratricopeptide (TPR) repeat protein